MKRPQARLTRRAHLLLAVLAVLLVIAAFSRQWLAGMPNALARQCLTRRDEAGALAWLRFSKRLAADNPETEFLLARLHRRRGEMDLVRDHLIRAADLGWPLDRIEREQWLALAQSGQMQAAEPHLSELLTDPRGDEAEVCEAYVIGALKMHYLGVAAKLLDVWIKDWPNDPQPYYLRGAMYRHEYSHAKAEADLRRALNLNPVHAAAALLLAEILCERSEFEEALSFFQVAELGQMEKAAALIGQARCQRALGRPDAARQLLHSVLAACKNDDEAIIELARLDLDERNYQVAIDRLAPLAERGSRSRDLHFMLGTALGRVGRKEEARTHLEYFTEAGDQLDRAARLVPEVARRPRDADLRYRIGKVYLDYGLPRDGLTWLASALECDPGHKPTHLALADYYQDKIGEAPTYAALAEQHRRLAGE